MTSKESIGHRRYLAHVTVQDQGKGGRPRIFGYGYGWIASIASVSLGTVRNAVSAGRLVAEDPVEVVAWALERRGETALAERVRAALAATEES